jgi:hypothetical protein
MNMDPVYKGKEFEAIELEFKDNTERLYRMTMIDLRIFSGFITLQLLLGGWMAKDGADIGPALRVAFAAIDISLAYVAIALLRNNSLRRKETSEIVQNCARALGFCETGIYLKDRALNPKLTLRIWKNYYYYGILVALVGFLFVLFFVGQHIPPAK